MSDKAEIHPDGLAHPSPSIEAAVRGELMTPQQGAALLDELAELRRRAGAYDAIEQWLRGDVDRQLPQGAVDAAWRGYVRAYDWAGAADLGTSPERAAERGGQV